MSRTANIFARVEPEVKSEAEAVLADLGIPMSNAIGMFLRQVVLQRGLPFEVRLPTRSGLDLSGMSDVEIDHQLALGLADLSEGRVLAEQELRSRLEDRTIS